MIILYLFEISLVDPLTLTIILYLFKSLHQYHISKLSSTPFLLLYISLFVVYTVNFLVVRPRSCRVIYYFNTPTLRRKHQLFDRVTKHARKAYLVMTLYKLGKSDL
jgi:hypothetical protein